MELKNFMEDVVLAKMDQVLDQYPDCCRCEQCRRDIAILALNHLPAHYVSTEKGEIFTRVQAMSFEYEVEVIQQIAKAIETVSAHPRHPKRE
ncbi:MAG: late competence development ComFB family protein [Veillonellaceae bacterium]|jgi:competence protein ComFB|uniref:late competence development ComFB family protein n=1 Tax=uncultured Selenomonas sp. TaxID=159275 RepID=UPI0025E5E7DE|nr:late competence development ComFB family protein [uncultured Selenomonas sp.]MCI7540238.1 late competence development ComFB family protein [Veillonellaceae bacterium]MDD6127873.1 late competence development ComFB family protein [Veillonellaceae bacterium]MDD6696956.1 late competence development ComFB family protein [Veillonellaceae bacterium]MDY6350247.1 late competence development ComFB family protein [Selenomonas sp.]